MLLQILKVAQFGCIIIWLVMFFAKDLCATIFYNAMEILSVVGMLDL